MRLTYVILSTIERHRSGEPSEYKFEIELRGRTLDGCPLSKGPTEIGVSRDVFQHYAVGDELILTFEPD